MTINELMSNHLVHLIKNYIYPGEYITRHIIVTFIPPILYYLHERLRYNEKTEYFYDLIINIFSLAAEKMENELFPINDAVINWINSDTFKKMIKDIIKYCNIKKVAVFKAYHNLQIKKNSISVNEIYEEIEQINQYIEKNNKKYKKKIVKLYYEGAKTIQNCCEGR